jgi:hypothetical protein
MPPAKSPIAIIGAAGFLYPRAHESAEMPRVAVLGNTRSKD